MKITALETIRIDEFPNLIWLQVRTDEGVSGLGETFYLSKTVEAYVHEALAQKLLGRNPLEIDRISKDLTGYLGFRSTGVEMRGNSALDIALWDVFGKVSGQPLAQLLGGFYADEDPHLQHLRRLVLHAQGDRTDYIQLRYWRR